MKKHEGHNPKVHLNSNVQGFKPSATVAINDLSNELKKKGREIFKFGLGQSPFPVPEPVAEALRQNCSISDASCIPNEHIFVLGCLCSKIPWLA